MDDFGSMYAPMDYRGMDNYGGALFSVERWPAWWQSRSYFFCGEE